jgi:hypothetical protein
MVLFKLSIFRTVDLPISLLPFFHLITLYCMAVHLLYFQVDMPSVPNSASLKIRFFASSGSPCINSLHCCTSSSSPLTINSLEARSNVWTKVMFDIAPALRRVTTCLRYSTLRLRLSMSYSLNSFLIAL